MPVIVDTYNVLQTVGVLPPDLAGIDVAGLIGLLASSRYGQEQIHLICDGYPPTQGAPPRRVGTIGVSYAGSQSADAMIDKFVRNSSHPKQLLVVSADHEVQRSARRRRSKTITSEQFLQQLVDDARKPARPKQPAKPAPPISDKQVERWKSLFGLDDAEQRRAVEAGARLPAHLRRSRQTSNENGQKPESTDYKRPASTSEPASRG